MRTFLASRLRDPVILFCIVSTIVGSLITFLLPPLFGNDEIVHFPRAYQIAQGNWWEDQLSERDWGGQVPVQVKAFNDQFREQVQIQDTDEQRLDQLIRQYKHEKIEGTQTEALQFSSAGVYSPWSYLPSAFGVKIADILHLPLVWYVWLGRLTSLLFWILLTYIALRLLPAGKVFMVAIALLPTSLVQAANLGMDGVVNGLSWIIIALTFAIMSGKVRLNARVATALVGMAFFLATTKQSYIPIALFPVIIPAKLYVFTAARRKYIAVARTIFAAAVVLVSMFYISKMLPLTSMLHYVQRPGINVDSHAQILYIAENPLRVLYIIAVQPFTVYSAGVWAGTVGVITNKMIYFPVITVISLYITLITAFITGSKAYGFAEHYAKRVGLASIAVLAGTFMLIGLALFVAFTTVGHPYVEGLQGRYYLPLAPLAIGIMALLPAAKKWRMPIWAYGVVIIGVFTGIITALTGIAQLL